MMVSLLGFIGCAFLIGVSALRSWAFAFMIVFIAMFIASIVSMTKAPADSFAMSDFGFHEKPSKTVVVYPKKRAASAKAKSARKKR
ncbi:MAG: hypothetical protein V1659_04660 [Candidatus Woesearchaeota archaeon]